MVHKGTTIKNTTIHKLLLSMPFFSFKIQISQEFLQLAMLVFHFFLFIKTILFTVHIYEQYQMMNGWIIIVPTIEYQCNVITPLNQHQCVRLVRNGLRGTPNAQQCHFRNGKLGYKIEEYYIILNIVKQNSFD